MRLFIRMVIAVLTVNEVWCGNDTIGTLTMKSEVTNDSCTLNNITDASPLSSVCDNNEHIFDLHFKDSHIILFPKIFNSFPNLRSVDISNAGIQHIDTTTFENAFHLTGLFMEGSNMSILPNYVFSHTNNLTGLVLSNSNISTVDKNAFQGLSNLKRLDLSFNNIKNLDGDMFHPMSQLEEILFTNNKIEAINDDLFARNSQLKWANFSSNKIIVVEMNSFIHTKLISLDLGYNDLPGVDISTLKYLKTLTVANNKLSTLIVPSTANEIHAENNSITAIRSTEPNELSKLYLASNHLINLKNLSQFVKLEYLDLSNNQFSTFQFSDLKSLIKLKELTLSGNGLPEINGNDVIRNLPNLKMINLTTKNWSRDFVKNLNDLLKKHSIYLIDHNDEPVPDMITTIPSPPRTEKPTSSTTNISTPVPKASPIPSKVTETPQQESVEQSLQKIADRLHNIEDSMTKSNSDLISTFQTFKVLLIIVFIVGMMFVLFKMVVYSKKFLNGMRYRRAQSSDALFSEQDL